MRDADVIIVGAGPAGLATALHLLQLDPSWAGRVIVLEKAAHPRPKLCGGGITLFGLRELRGLGLELPVRAAPVETVRFRMGGREFTARDQPVFVVCRREELDAWLADCLRERGGRLVENQEVREVAVGPQGVTLATATSEYRAGVLVAADGSRGLVRRKLGLDSDASPVSRLLEVLAPADETRDPEFTQRSAIFDFSAVSQGLQGYAWSFPSFVQGRATLNLGIYDSRVRARAPKAPLKPLLADHVKQRGARFHDRDVQGHPIRLFSPWARFARPRALLVGDAAGADPWVGEGIGMALAYGRLAAAEIASAFQTGRFGFAGYRQRILVSPLGRYLMSRWLIAQAFYRMSGRSWFTSAVWRLGAKACRGLQKLDLL